MGAVGGITQISRQVIATTSHLGILRAALGVGLVLANVAVWYGVRLENDEFPKEKQDKGWRILLRALAAEAGLAALLLVLDITISAIQSRDIALAQLETARISLEIAPRRLPANILSDKDILAPLSNLAGKVVRVDSYEHDLEAWALGMQVIAVLTTEHVQVRNSLMTTPATGNIDTGVHVTNGDTDIASNLLIFFKTAQIDAVNHPPPNSTLRAVDTPTLPVATVFVGVKPLSP